ncbi:MAG TPA: YceI family protein [Cyclobacteriaceae bacterium]|nr:YceI family protein [Cyclobacteriaceae bacterium]
MKKIKVLTAVFLVLFVGFFAMQCQHEDEDVIPVVGPDPIEHGNEIITCTDCNITSVGPGIWYHDKSHSNVMWETPYKQFGSLLTGRFDYFIINSLNFDEAVPANISFNGHVRLNSVNTSEPGRDDGCLLSTFGTNGTNTDEPANLATLVSIPGTGRYSSTDAGFLVDANFTFLGITKVVTVKMYFAPKFDIGTAYAAGLYSEFEMNALADFLPGNTNIGEIVKVRINSLMRNKK